MNRRNLLVSAALAAAATACALALVLGPAPIDAAPDPSAPQLLRDGDILTRDGGVYVLDHDIVHQGDLEDFESVIVVNAREILIDCTSFGISATGRGALIRLGSRASGVTIRNARLVGGGSAIRGSTSGDLRIERTSCTGQTGDAVDLTLAPADARVEIAGLRVDGASGNAIVTNVPDVTVIPNFAGGRPSVVLKDVVANDVGGGLAVVSDGIVTDDEYFQVRVENVRVRNCRGTAVNIRNASRVSVTDSDWTACGGNGLDVEGCQRVEVSRCRATDVTGDGISFQSQTTPHADGLLAVIDRSTVLRAGGNGIWINQREIPAASIEVTGNSVEDVGLVGILVTGAAGTTTQGRVADNTVSRFGTSFGGAAPDPEASAPAPACDLPNMNAGISVRAVNQFSADAYLNEMGIHDNRVNGNLAISSVGIEAALSGGSVEDNGVSGCGVGISVRGDGNVVSGNRARRCLTFGIVLVGAANVCRDNLSAGNDQGVQLADATSTLVEGSHFARNAFYAIDGGDSSNHVRRSSFIANGSVLFGGTLGLGNVVVP